MGNRDVLWVCHSGIDIVAFHQAVMEDSIPRMVREELVPDRIGRVWPGWQLSRGDNTYLFRLLRTVAGNWALYPFECMPLTSLASIARALGVTTLQLLTRPYTTIRRGQRGSAKLVSTMGLVL